VVGRASKTTTQCSAAVCRASTSTAQARSSLQFLSSKLIYRILRFFKGQSLTIFGF